MIAHNDLHWHSLALILCIINNLCQETAAQHTPAFPCNNTVLSEQHLINMLFSNYSPIARPRPSSRHPVVVSIGLRLSGIVLFDEIRNSLTITGYVYLDWDDEYLMWNRRYPYSCIDYLLLPKAKVWSPDLLVLNADDVYTLVVSPGGKIWLRSDGLIQFTPAYQMSIKCEPDLTMFPFDSQICPIRIESWNYPRTLQQLRLIGEDSFIKIENSWTENKQWELLGNTSKVLQYSSGNHMYDMALFTVLLKRRPSFYYVTIIAPSLTIAAAELITFLLPIEDVVRVHVSFTCLLAYSIFQSMILSDMPRSSECIPLLSLYIELQMIYIALIALLGEGVVFYFIFKANLRKKKPPRCMFVSFQWLGRLLLVEYRFNVMSAISAALPLDENLIHKSVTLNTAAPIMLPARRRSMRYFTEQTLREIHDQWFFIAEVTERFNMLLYISAVIVTPVIMFQLTPPTKTLQ